METKCEGQVGDKCKLMRPTQSGTQVWEISVGDECGRQCVNCKLMRPKAPRVADKCERQVEHTGVNSCGPRHPEWDASP